MRLLLLTSLCVLATADHHGKDISTAELAGGLGYLYRRFLRVAAPDQIELQDAMNVQYRDGMLGSIPVRSAAKVTFEGTERPSYSMIHSIINPETKGFDGKGNWFKNTLLDVLVFHNYGATLKVHLMTDGGVHKALVLGCPLKHDEAKFSMIIPRDTFVMVENHSQKEFAFLSYVSVPGWSEEGHKEVTVDEMLEKFPDHEELLKELSYKYQSTKKRHDDDEDHHHDDHDDHDDHHHHAHKHSLHRH